MLRFGLRDWHLASFVHAPGSIIESERNRHMLIRICFSLKSFTLLILALPSVVYIGCSSSQLTNTWRDPDFKGPAMANMLIVAAKNNAVNRRLWEDEFVSALSPYGVSATSSYQLFPDSIPNPDQVGSIVREKKFDGVLFLRKLPTEVSTVYVPGPVKNERVTQYDARSQTYYTFYRDVQQPGYSDTSKIVRHEIIVFSAQPEGGHLVWAGTGEMINPSSVEQVRDEITGLIVPELSRETIIPKK